MGELVEGIGVPTAKEWRSVAGMPCPRPDRPQTGRMPPAGRAGLAAGARGSRPAPSRLLNTMETQPPAGREMNFIVRDTATIKTEFGLPGPRHEDD